METPRDVRGVFFLGRVAKSGRVGQAVFMEDDRTRTAEQCWQAACACTVETNDNGAVLTEQDCGTRHYLNATAAIVYLLCDKCHSTDDIAGFIADQFDLKDLPTRDVEDALAQLSNKGLIERG